MESRGRGAQRRALEIYVVKAVADAEKFMQTIVALDWISLSVAKGIRLLDRLGHSSFGSPRAFVFWIASGIRRLLPLAEGRCITTFHVVHGQIE